MSWVAVAAAVVAGVGAATSNNTANANAQAANTIEEQNAISANQVRSSRNELTQAKGRLARANQIENNRRIAQAGSKALEAANSNAVRAKDNAIKGDLEQQIGFAEQAGAAHAKQAFAGVSGGVVDMVNGTTALRAARIAQSTVDRNLALGIDAKNQALDIQKAMIEQQDTSSIMDNLDYNVTVPRVRQIKNGNFDILLAGAQAYFGAGGGNKSSGEDDFSGSGIQQSNRGREGSNSFFRPSDNYGGDML